MYRAVYLNTGSHPRLLGISQAAAMIFNPNGSKGLRSKGASSREKEEAESDPQEGISWPAIRGKLELTFNQRQKETVRR